MDHSAPNAVDPSRAADVGPGQVGPAATPNERAVLAVLVTWIALGLAVDTRRHRTDASLDTFFTSAHGLLYAGWIASAVFVLWTRRRRGHVPHGFEVSAVGAGLFAFGGVGDALWHGAFGIEAELKILFSPTHLFLMTAMLLLAFGPIRAAWRTKDLGPAPHLRGFWPVALATGASTSVLIVFFQYASPFEQPIFTTKVPNFLGAAQFLQVEGILGVVVTTLLLFGPVLLLARRWILPFGTCLVSFGVVAGSVWVYRDFRSGRLLLSLFAGALLCDLTRAALRAWFTPRIAFRVFGAVGPLLVWGAYLAFTVVDDPIAWPAELWTGTLVWSALIGLALTVLLLPPAFPHGVGGAPIDATDESLHVHDDIPDDATAAIRETVTGIPDMDAREHVTLRSPR